MRPITFFVAILAVTPFATVTAQQPLSAGRRVRITAPGLGLARFTSAVTAMSPDTLNLSGLRIPIASITKLEIARGTKSIGIGRGAGIGFLVGALTGAIIGATYESPEPECESASQGDDPIGIAVGCTDVISPEMLVIGGAIVLGAVGAGIGAVIGSIKSDRWEEVPLDQLRVSFVPQRDGRFAFGLSVRF